MPARLLGSSAPHRLQRLALLRDRYFFTLPIELLEAVVEQVGEKRFDPYILKLDRKLGRKNGDHSAIVGFRNCQPVGYPLLARPLGITAALFDLASSGIDLGWNLSSSNQEALRSLQGHPDSFAAVARAYAGWLAINKDFHREQKEFYRLYGADIMTFGLKRPAASSPALLATASSAAPRYLRFVNAQAALLARWHLTDIAGPFLVQPVTPQIPALPQPLLMAVQGMGVQFFWPSLFPLPARDVLRRMLEQAMGSQRLPPHLQGWQKIVSNDARAKNRFPRLARLFLLQHYWRALHSRHATALKGRLREARLGFASFLLPDLDIDNEPDKADELIKKDLQTIANARGGAKWCDPSSGAYIGF